MKKVTILNALSVLLLSSVIGLWAQNPMPKLNVDAKDMVRTDKGAYPNSYNKIISKSSPSVVSVLSTRQGNRSRQGQAGQGSGVIVSADGYIITNNHVIEGASRIQVSIDKKEQFEAKLIGRDPKSDIAVLKIEGKNLSPIVIADSDNSRVGDIVFAIGNPFGLGKTVTKGIVSAKGRAFGLVDYENFIQTDASINPGNSGGALIDAQGRLIGINTAILSRTGGSQGVGFAIPANQAVSVMKSLVKEGQVKRGYLGVAIESVTKAKQTELKMKDIHGALVNGVGPGTAAERAGIKPGDVISKINGEKVADVRDLRMKISNNPPGKTITLTLIREPGKTTLQAVKLDDLKSMKEINTQPRQPDPFRRRR